MGRQRTVIGCRKKSSFLKKRSKKLLLLKQDVGVNPRAACGPRQRNKSFLVLFFKKELLPCLPSPDYPGTLRHAGCSKAAFLI
jgi:hypothetical protein